MGVANPLSSKYDMLRSSLLPGLIDAVAYNRRHQRVDVALFEIGARFTASGGETRGVGLAWTGAASPDHWSGTRRDVDLFDVKGVVEQMCEALGAAVRLEAAAAPSLVDGQAAKVLMGDLAVGFLGLVAPALAEKRGAPRQDKIFVAELNLDRLPLARRRSRSLTLPLGRSCAISVVVADTLPAAIIRADCAASNAGAAAPIALLRSLSRQSG